MPVAGIDVGRGSSPAFGDVDADGDQDMVVGEEYTATFYYYENTGTAVAPVYTARTGADNPFDGCKAAKYLSAPVLADLVSGCDNGKLYGFGNDSALFSFQ